MNTTRFHHPTDPARQFVERRGGWILALCLILTLFAWLRAQTVPLVQGEPVTERAEVRVALALPESTPLPGPRPPTDLIGEHALPDPIVRNAGNDRPLPATPRQPDRLIPQEETDPMPDMTLDAMASDVAMAQAVQFMDRRLNQVQLQAREQAEQGSSEVAQRLRMARAKVVANKTLFSTRGSRQGVIRELDTSDVSESVAQQVLDRYGCKIMLARVGAANPGGLEYLSSAHTAQGLFVNRAGRGGSRVFSYPMSAVARMSQLEEDAIVRKGLDPAKTRVTRVLFGVLPTTAGWDLAVKEIDFVPLPGADETEAGPPDRGE